MAGVLETERERERGARSVTEACLLQLDGSVMVSELSHRWIIDAQFSHSC